MTVAVSLLRRYLPALVFLAWLYACSALLIDGSYQTFLRPEFGWLVGLAVLCLAFFLAFSLYRERDSSHAGQTHERLAQACLLLLPLLYLVPAKDDSLGGYAFEKRGAGRIAPFGGFRRGAEPAEDGTLSLLQVWNGMDTLAGQRVTVDGMLLKEREGIPPGSVVVFRFLIFCCAADAQPVWLVADCAQPERFDNDAWVRVSGTLALCTVEDTEVPCLRDTAFEAIDRPRNPYLY